MIDSSAELGLSSNLGFVIGIHAERRPVDRGKLRRRRQRSGQHNAPRNGTKPQW